MFHVKHQKMLYQQVKRKIPYLQEKIYKTSIKKEYIIIFIYPFNYIILNYSDSLEVFSSSVSVSITEIELTF